MTVPWHADGESVEHYPDALGYDVDGRQEVDIKDGAGGRRPAPDPNFHGGPGATLEMRVFSLPGILRCLKDAAFRSVRVLREDLLEFGIRHPTASSLPLLARR